MADTSAGWAIQHIDGDMYRIRNLLGYNATEVDIRGPNVAYARIRILDSEWQAHYSIIDADADIPATLVPKLEGQPSKFRLKISWTDTTGENHSDWYSIPTTDANTTTANCSSGYDKPVSTPIPQDVPDPKAVFVVHGRNKKANDSMFTFLYALDLNPMEWSKALKASENPNPFIGEVLELALKKAQAIVVLMTPDEMVYLLPDRANKPGEADTKPAAQPRPNVLFEAGMAMGRNPNRTVLVELGTLRPFSDIAGRHTLRLDDSIQRRKDLAQRLQTAGCAVDMTGEQWMTAGDFTPPEVPAGP
jgi:predicted nucleotide-binding protein